MTVCRAFQVRSDDNVATLLDDLPAPASVQVIGGVPGHEHVPAAEPIALGHKIALADIPAGAAVVKFGVAIGAASAPIRRGEWVHLHNLASGFDQRSQTLDVHTGAVTDTRYE